MPLGLSPEAPRIVYKELLCITSRSSGAEESIQEEDMDGIDYYYYYDILVHLRVEGGGQRGQ